jgi:hypothetical protein
MRTLLLALVLAATASADTVGTFSLNTSGLIGSPNGPFTLDFQLVENTPSLNQVMLSNFDPSTGFIDTFPSFTFGGVTVQQSPFSVFLDGSSFLNDAQFSFTPGATLAFNVDATTNSDPIAPDTFTFAILDGNGVEIPTTNSFFDVFAEIDLPTPTTPPAVTTSPTDPNRTTITVNAPIFSGNAPEPSAWVLVAIGVGVFFTAETLRSLRKRREDEKQ